MSIHRRQNKRKIDEKLAKVRTEMKILQKTFPEPDFYEFWLDFGVPRRPPNHQKWIKKQAEKVAKK